METQALRKQLESEGVEARQDRLAPNELFMSNLRDCIWRAPPHTDLWPCNTSSNVGDTCTSRMSNCAMRAGHQGHRLSCSPCVLQP